MTRERDPCPDCGLDRAMVGRVHRCDPRRLRRTNADAVNAPDDAVNGHASAVNKSRGAYPGTDARRVYMREYMRRRRAKARD